MAVDAGVAQRRIFVAPEGEDGLIHVASVEDAEADEQVEVVDGEAGDRLEQWGGYINTWRDTFQTTFVSAGVDSVSGGADESARFLRVEVTGNVRNPAGWTGGGATIVFTACPDGIDLSQYDSLLVDIKVFSGQNLEYFKIKLLDNTGNATPERFLNQFGDFPSSDWKTCRIPLNRFIADPNDFPAHTWQSVDFRHVIGVATVSVNDKSVSGTVSGVVGVDEIQFRTK